MDNLGYLGLAYTFVWFALAAYLILLARRQQRLERRLEQLKARQPSE